MKECNELVLHDPKLVTQVRSASAYMGITSEQFVENALRSYLDDYQSKRLLEESNVWYALSAETRNQYRGLYAAVYQGEIVGMDEDQVDLYYRMHKAYNGEPVLIIPGGDDPMPTYRFPSIRLESENVNKLLPSASSTRKIREITLEKPRI